MLTLEAFQNYIVHVLLTWLSVIFTFIAMLY